MFSQKFPLLPEGNTTGKAGMKQLVPSGKSWRSQAPIRRNFLTVSGPKEEGIAQE